MNHSNKNYSAFFLSNLGYKRGLTAINLICNICIFSYQAAVAYFVRQCLNSLEAGGSGRALSTAAIYLLGIAAVSLGRVIAIMLVSYLDNLRSYYYQNRVRTNMLRGLFRQKDIAAVAGNSGKLFEVLDDDIPAAVFPAEIFTEVTGYCVYTLITLGLLFSINWQVTLFIFVPLSLSLFLVQRLSDRIKERRRKSREAHDEISSFMGDLADSVLSVKTAGAVAPVTEEFERKSGKRRAAMLEDLGFNIKLEAFLKLAVFLGTVVMMLVAVRLMAGGSFGLGDFSIFVLSLGALGDCVNRFVEMTGDVKKAEVSYERILTALQTDSHRSLLQEPGIALKDITPEAAAPVPRQPLTAFDGKNLSFSYGDIPVLRDVNLRITPGQLVVVTGSVGAGKSTLMNLLSGAVPPISGKLLWNERPAAALFPPNVAVAGQTPGFFSGSLRQNISLGLELSEEAVNRALRLSALEPRDFSQGLDTQIGSRGVMLSGGQRQRLALARMFARDATLYLVDDCVSALDEGTQRCLLNNIRQHLQKTGHAMILATNVQAFVSAADRVISL